MAVRTGARAAPPERKLAARARRTSDLRASLRGPTGDRLDVGWGGTGAICGGHAVD